MIHRNQALDVLRGIAVLIVIIHHYTQNQNSILHVGGAGVDLFFVLSGFLICELLFSEIVRTGNLSLWRFLVRRGLKIYPAFYVFLLLTLPLVPWGERTRLWPEAFFLQQYLPHVWQHTWSLSVEETFYIGTPLLITGLHKTRRLVWFPAIAVAAVIGLTLYRIAGHTPIRLEGLAIGSFLAYIHAFHNSRLRRICGWWLLPLSVVFIVPAFALKYDQLVFTSNTLAFAMTVSWAVFHPGFSIPGLSAIGRYSYSIYLWHMPIAMFWWASSLNPLVVFLADVGCTLAIGIAMSNLVEMPILKIRNRAFPSLVSSMRGSSIVAHGTAGVAVAP